MSACYSERRLFVPSYSVEMQLLVVARRDAQAHRSSRPGSSSHDGITISSLHVFNRKKRSTNIPSVKLLIASLLWGFWARYLSVTSGSPSLIIKWIIIKLLKTIVHVESRSRFVRARKISATPASPAWVATRMCSTYLDLGAASYVYGMHRLARPKSRTGGRCRRVQTALLTLILVPPFTDFSNELAILLGVVDGGAGAAEQAVVVAVGGRRAIAAYRSAAVGGGQQEE
jgi:hypothetical protein